MPLILKRNLLLQRFGSSVFLAFLLALFLYALWPWLPASGKSRRPRTVIFYGFSILGEVINQGIFPAFQRQWEEQGGEHIELVSSFAGSGTVTNQLIMGVPAQLALLSLEPDAQRLAAAGVIPEESWKKFPSSGIVNRTPFVILVREGNPKKIHDFADLTQPGVQIVHPDPLTSGGANWAIVAEYGAGMRQNAGDGEAGYKMLLGIWRNVVARAASARAARTQFENGFGDALITYEQEVLWDRQRGKLKGEIVYPKSTILSEHTLVRMTQHIPPRDRKLLDALVEFLWSEAGQKIFVQYGFRSMDEKINRQNDTFGQVDDLFLIADFGGWKEAKKKIVEEVWKKRVLEEIGK